MKTKPIIFFVFLCVGMCLGVGTLIAIQSLFGTTLFGTTFGVKARLLAKDDVEDSPLYWVAPMDANYRRDGPGKSPMGMDLVPVYKTQETDSLPGVVFVQPNIIQSFGVKSARAEARPWASNITAFGIVKYDENRIYHIHPRVSGWVENLFVKAQGDPVEKGQPLYAIYSPELVNAQEELLLAISRKNRRLINAAEARLRALQLPVDFIEAIKTTKNVQQSVTFFAPKDGYVENLSIREGFYVQPGTTLFSIASLETVWIETDIFEKDAPFVSLNSSVSTSVTMYPDKVWQGKVDYIYPVVMAKSGALKIRSVLKNPSERLKPNMFAEVSVTSQDVAKVVVVPKDAVIRVENQQRVVMDLGEGKFKSIAVVVGRINDAYVEIQQGLMDGDRVVVSAQFLLDSESSKSSDFKRIDQQALSSTGISHQSDVSQQNESVYVLGEIRQRDIDNRQVTAWHEAIEDWGWPEMVMEFRVQASVDIEALIPGTRLHMEIRGHESGMYEIYSVHIMSMEGNHNH